MVSVMKKLRIVYVALLIVLGKSAFSQNILERQKSMAKLGFEMYNNPNELERLNANYAFIKELVIALKTPKSYYTSFDSLKMISIQTSPDDPFRIFSWQDRKSTRLNSSH